MADCCVDCKCALSNCLCIYCPDVNAFRCIDCFKKFVEGGNRG